MSLLAETKLLLRRYRIFPNKAFGQNFVIDSSVLHRMINYASLNAEDIVLDIGAGFGFLSRLLADKCKHVLAVESDRRLVRILHERLRDVPNIQIIEGDILKLHLPSFNKVVSIPPYSISSHLLMWLFHQKFDSALLILQKEFVERLIAPIKSEYYGWLSVLSYCHSEINPLDDVPREVFYPEPKVDSVIVSIKPKIPTPFTVRDEKLFKKLVQLLFTHRNRKVRNAIASFSASVHLKNRNNDLIKKFHFMDKRVRELAPEDFGALSNALSD